MDKVEKEIIKEEIFEEEYPKRIFAKKITLGVLEDADIPLEGLSELEFKTTKDFSIARKLLNAMIVEGPPITRDTEPMELLFYIDELKSFLEKSRRIEAAREKMKAMRSPKL